MSRLLLTLAFSPDGKWLAVGYGKAVDLWNIEQPSQARHAGIKVEGTRVSALAFSPKGGVLAVGNADGKVFLYETATSELRGTFQAGAAEALAFSPDGRILATGGAGGTVKLWDSATRREFLTLTGSPSAVVSIAFSPDGEKLAIATARTLRVWRAPKTVGPAVEPKAEGAGR